jgi:hypothetical protein
MEGKTNHLTEVASQMVSEFIACGWVDNIPEGE